MDRDKIVYLVLAALVLAFATWSAFTLVVFVWIFDESWGWASDVFGSITIAGVFLGILSRPTTVDWLWRQIPALNVWVAPNLNGEYVLETSSNWSIQKRMLDCVDGRSSTPSAAPPDDSELLRVSGKLTIRLGLLSIEAHYVPNTAEASRSESFIVTAGVESPRRDGCFWFHYVFEGRVPNPIATTDSDTYYGAASLRVEHGSTDKMEGYYWTNRSWRKGINTAGKARITRSAQSA
jgi:hypothetical protein